MLKSNQGIAMVVVVAMVVILLSITGGTLLFSGLNLKKASNLKTGASLIQVADAGVQHALAVVEQGSSLNYTNQTTVVSTTIFPAGSQYTYRVTALNGPGSGQATLTSTANGPNSSKAVVQVVVERRLLSTVFPVNSAISLLGEAESYFPSTSFVIDGNDYNLDGTANTSNPAKRGIAVGDITSPSSQTPTSALNGLNGALSTDQKDNHVLGLGHDASTDTPSTGIDNTLTKQATVDFVNYLKGIKDSYLTVSNTSGGATAGDVSGTLSNSSTYNSSTQQNEITIGGKTVKLGTTSSPKIVFFEGVRAGLPGDQRLIFNGNITGAGILVMKENDLQFYGQLDWKGLIIVTGPETSMRFGGTGLQNVLGAIVNNETSTDDGYIELWIDNSNANSKYRASKAALDMVQTMLDNKASLKVLAWKQNM